MSRSGQRRRPTRTKKITNAVRAKSRLGEGAELQTITNNYKTADRTRPPAGPPVGAPHATIRTVATRPCLDNFGARPGPQSLSTSGNNYKTADRRLQPAGPPVETRHATMRTVATHPGLDNFGARPGPQTYKQCQITTNAVRAKSSLGEGVELQTIKNSYETADRRQHPAGPTVAARRAAIRIMVHRPGPDIIDPRPEPI